MKKLNKNMKKIMLKIAKMLFYGHEILVCFALAPPSSVEDGYCLPLTVNPSLYLIAEIRPAIYLQYQCTKLQS